MPPKAKAVPADTKPTDGTRLPFFEISRKVLLAAVGAAALAQDEVEEFINRLVERGEIADKDGRKLMREIIERRKAKREKIKEEAGKRFGAALSRMDVPTRKDIELLHEKINALTQKVEALKKGE